MPDFIPTIELLGIPFILPPVAELDHMCSVYGQQEIVTIDLSEWMIKMICDSTTSQRCTKISYSNSTHISSIIPYGADAENIPKLVKLRNNIQYHQNIHHQGGGIVCLVEPNWGIWDTLLELIISSMSEPDIRNNLSSTTTLKNETSIATIATVQSIDTSAPAAETVSYETTLTESIGSTTQSLIHTTATMPNEIVKFNITQNETLSQTEHNTLMTLQDIQSNPINSTSITWEGAGVIGAIGIGGIIAGGMAIICIGSGIAVLGVGLGVAFLYYEHKINTSLCRTAPSQNSIV